MKACHFVSLFQSFSRLTMQGLNSIQHVLPTFLAVWYS
jgi:hypothetical protein